MKFPYASRGAVYLEKLLHEVDDKDKGEIDMTMKAYTNMGAFETIAGTDINQENILDAINAATNCIRLADLVADIKITDDIAAESYMRAYTDIVKEFPDMSKAKVLFTLALADTEFSVILMGEARGRISHGAGGTSKGYP